MRFPVDMSTPRSMAIERGAPAMLADRPAYSILSLVNDDAQYAAMCASFRGHGFAEPDAEFLAARGAPSAYAGLNALIAEARGELLILCHQDVRLIGDGRAELEACLAELDQRDANWAVAGNAGGTGPGALAMRITDPHGRNRLLGPLPARVISLDENFIVLRRQAGLGFSRNLDGFHLYGADICLVADVLGLSAWVIDFHLEHLSPGRKDASFLAAERRFEAKWAHALRPRWMQTTCTLIRLSGNRLGRAAGRLSQGSFRRLSRRLPGSTGFEPRAAGDVDGR